MLAVLSHLFEMVEEHYYWVTYVWAKNAIFGKPVIAVLSSGTCDLVLAARYTMVPILSYSSV